MILSWSLLWVCNSIMEMIWWVEKQTSCEESLEAAMAVWGLERRAVARQLRKSFQTESIRIILRGGVLSGISELWLNCHMSVTFSSFLKLRKRLQTISFPLLPENLPLGVLSGKLWLAFAICVILGAFQVVDPDPNPFCVTTIQKIYNCCSSYRTKLLKA